jgi:UDP-N-acetylmuramoyl-L-alanyl-D-glutamate--2,6-diaminopimelate ligase
MAQLSALLHNRCDYRIDFKQEIVGLAVDSRQVKPGYLFLAYRGILHDGRDYIPDAIAKGASAILVDVAEKSLPSLRHSTVPCIAVPYLKELIPEMAAQFYHYPARSLRIMGVTGTNGKTSCTHFMAEALHRLGISSGMIGTLGNGLYGNLKETALTTPDPITLQKTFSELLSQGVKTVAMEVSSHSLDQGRVKGIEFEVGVFTNLTQDHLDYHGTMDNYGRAKQKLFDQARFSVINADDKFGRQLIMALPEENLFVYGIENYSTKNFIYAEKIQLALSGIHATLHSPWGTGDIHVPLIGRFNLSNLLAAFTTLCIMGVPFEQVLQSMKHLTPVPGRMQTLGGVTQPLVVVDYSHTPDSLEKALMALRAHCQGKLLCLFGCGGDRDRGKRPLMAKIAEQYADYVMVTDDNPRTEDPKQIVKDILCGFSDPAKINVQHSRSKAIQDIIQSAQLGDCVLIAGRGAEPYQQIGMEKIPFSDVLQAQAALHSHLE